jgi:hypothetical protein
MAPRAGEALGQYDAGISSAMTPTLDTTLNRITRGVYVGSSGTLEVQFAGDQDSAPVTLNGLAAGVWHPMQIQKIISAGTTATGILVGF